MDSDERIERLFTDRELYLMRAVWGEACPRHVSEWAWDEAFYRWLNSGICDGGYVVADQLDRECRARTGGA